MPESDARVARHPDPPAVPDHPGALTRRQRETLQALRRLLASTAAPVTLDALCAALGVSSRGSLHKHVQALVAAGLIEPARGLRRGLALTPAGRAAVADTVVRERIERVAPTAWRSPLAGEDDAGSTVPLLGRIAAGRPIEALEVPDTFDPGEPWRGRSGLYALEVRGDSMIDAGIHDGDVVIVEAREYACDGEVVVALVDGESATLKVIEQRPDRVRLLPAHPGFAPLELDPDRVTIRGVVRGLVRRY
jgi:repressor LexA